MFLCLCCFCDQIHHSDANRGDEINVSDFLTIDDALTDAEKLLHHSRIGEGEGEYPLHAYQRLSQVIQNIKSDRDLTIRTELTNTINKLYNESARFESHIQLSLDELIDGQATRETHYLYQNLKNMSVDYLLFGMHDATGYGVGWRGDNDRSDVKNVCGSYPAVFSWDVSWIMNSRDLRDVYYRFLLGYKMGAVTTLCWHQLDPDKKGFYYDRVNHPVVPAILPEGEDHVFYKNSLRRLAVFVKTLRGENGESEPIIFRPYHEHNGNWFWWGKGHCTEQEYISLWRFTVHYLRDSLNVHNFIYAFSPDGNQYEEKSEYLYGYPGDDYVDILGMDFYFGSGDEIEIKKFQQRLIHIMEYARDKHKLAALTEVGDRYGWDETDRLEIDRWFTRCLLAPIKDHPLAREISYAAVWRNAHENHHFAPYPGHPSVPDFLEFYRDSVTLFLDDLPDMYSLAK